MATVGMPLIEHDTAKGREGEWKELEGRISEYAAEIRELMESGE